MAFLQKEKLFSKKWVFSYLFIIIGTLLMAIGFVFFITPYKLVPGGVYGISIVVHYLFNTPIGLVALCLDIPLTILGFYILGPRFGVKTVVGFVLTAVFVDVLTYFYGIEPLVKDDPLLSSIIGGVILGVGLGLIFRSKATSGGTDIVAMIIAKYTKLPVGQLLIMVDSLIVVFGFLIFPNWNVPFYSLIVIYITGRVIDIVMHGANYDKSLFIVSDKYEEIRKKIISDLNRGGTILNAEGMYNKDEKKVIFVNVNRREMAILQSYINDIDPKAFMTVMDANEVLGNGFKSLQDKVEA